MDKKTDARDHQTHDDGKGVKSETDGDAQFTGGDPVVDLSFKYPGRRRQLEKFPKNAYRGKKRQKYGETGDPGNKGFGSPASDGAIDDESQGREKGYQPDSVSHFHMSF
jgi:hypothetical protein